MSDGGLEPKYPAACAKWGGTSWSKKAPLSAISVLMGVLCLCLAALLANPVCGWFVLCSWQ